MRPVVLMVASLVMMLVGAVIAYHFRPTPPGAVAIEVDATASNGDALANMYTPLICRNLPAMTGKDVQVVFFAGPYRQQFYPVGRSYTLRAEEVPALRDRLLGSTVYPSSVRGSPITASAIEALRWLQARPGGSGSKVLIMCTDGIEQDWRVFTPAHIGRLGRGVSVVILCPSNRHPRIAEVLRASGAKVEVATSVEAADQAIAQILSGTSALNRGLHWSGIVLAVLSLLLGSSAVWQLARRPQKEFTEQRVPEATRQTPAPSSPELPDVILEAELQGNSVTSARCRRRLRCGGMETVWVAPASGGRSPDVALPVSHETWGIDLRLGVEDPEHMVLTNRGRTPVVVGQQIINPDQVVRVRAPYGACRILLSPKLWMQVRLTFPEEVRMT
jgi:hypothetical protein